MWVGATGVGPVAFYVRVYCGSSPGVIGASGFSTIAAMLHVYGQAVKWADTYLGLRRLTLGWA